MKEIKELIKRIKSQAVTDFEENKEEYSTTEAAILKVFAEKDKEKDEAVKLVRIQYDSVCEMFHRKEEEKDRQLAELEAQVNDLKAFAIWMTGCGYDFTQHQYFIDQRDKLFKSDNQTKEERG